MMARATGRRKTKARLLLVPSSESIGIAAALQENMAGTCETDIWPDPRLHQNHSSIQVFESRLKGTDLVVLIIDQPSASQQPTPTPTPLPSHTLVHLGMSLAAVGTHRTLLLVPSTFQLDFGELFRRLEIVRFEPVAPSDNATRALSPTASAIRRYLTQVNPARPKSIEHAVLTLISPNFDPSTPIRAILTRHLTSAITELDSLYYSGNYEAFAEFGSILTSAIEQSLPAEATLRYANQLIDVLFRLGRTSEARWAQVKLVAIAEMRTADHESARATLSLIKEIARSPRTVQQIALRVYCNRYLARSHTEDTYNGDVKKALVYLNSAMRDCERLQLRNTLAFKKLASRVNLEFARLHLATRDYEDACTYAGKALDVFREIQEGEYIPIANVVHATAELHILDHATPKDARERLTTVSQATRTGELSFRALELHGYLARALLQLYLKIDDRRHLKGALSHCDNAILVALQLAAPVNSLEILRENIRSLVGTE